LKVAILGINYSPEPTGIAPYSTGLAEGLARRGHDVRVLTGFPHYPQWKHSDSRRKLRVTETLGGVQLRRLRHYVPVNPTGIGRIAMELTFGMQLLTSRWGRPDVVLCVTPPLLASAAAVLRARLSWRRPAVGVLLHDVYSRGIVETGVMPAPAARAVRVIESALLRSADGVAVIHEGFTKGLVDDLRVDPNRIRAIRNWTHIGDPDPLASKVFRESRGWGPDEIVVLHAGNMGAKQGLANVVTAAELAAKEGRRVRFVLLGDGSQRAKLEAAGAGLPTLEIIPPVGDEDFSAVLGAADVLLVNEHAGVAQMAMPSKLTSYFAAGKPILAATDSTGLTARELAASDAGVRVPAGRPDLLLAEAIRLGTDRALATRLGESGRRYSADILSRDAALGRYEHWVSGLVGTRRRKGALS
jgi:glycosyltransferase involved in cell wall biosynthesis